MGEMGHHTQISGTPDFSAFTAAILIIATWQLSVAWGIGLLIFLVGLAIGLAIIKANN